MNPSEGRVPVSWDEVIAWLRGGQRASYSMPMCCGTWYPGAAADLLERYADKVELRNVRLLPPPGLVAAPEGMDGGGWVGSGRYCPKGWDWRYRDTNRWITDGEVPDRNSIVQCRPPVCPRAVVEVPLTRLVGRTIEGETDAVLEPPGWSPEDNEWTWFSTHGQRFFPDGSLDLDTGRVRVYAEGDEK